MGADSDQRDTPPVSSPAPKTASWLIPVLVAGITLVTFLPALRCGFVNWDDDRNLIANPMFRGFDADRLAWMVTTFYGGHYQPLTWLSYAVDHAVWGMRPVGYHLTNTLLHTLCAVLFYVVAIRVLTRVTDRPGPEREPLLRSGEAVVKWAAGFAALLFAVHPLRVESVVWVTERRDVLSGVFFLACLLAYMRAIDRARAVVALAPGGLGVHVAFAGSQGDWDDPPGGDAGDGCLPARRLAGRGGSPADNPD
jgi:hypothetical protein